MFGQKNELIKKSELFPCGRNKDKVEMRKKL